MSTYLGPRGGDFMLHIESAQRNLNTVDTITGAAGASAVKGIIALSAINAAIAPGGTLSGTAKFAVFGPPLNADDSDTGDAANPYTVIDDFTGAVLNESVLLAAGYDADDVAAIKAAVTGAKWVAEPAKTSVQVN